MSFRNIPIALPSAGLEEWQSTRESFETGWLTQGPKVAAFEQAFAQKHGTEYALATTSCTTALHLALISAGIGPGDEVIVPAFTWVASANVVIYCGAKPVFVDVDLQTFNILPEAIKGALSERTKAVIAVHLFGLCADIKAIRQCISEQVIIIEDAACAAGSRYFDKFAGGLGEIAAFSFHPRKSITTGEGGMLTTNSEALSQLANQLRNHGASISEEQRHHGPSPYRLPDFNLLGFNYRMTDIQGAVGLCQLNKLDSYIEERERFAEVYRTSLKKLTWLRCPEVKQGYRHSWQSYVLYVDPEGAPDTRNNIMEKLQLKGISTRPGTHAVHMLGYYKQRYSLNDDMFPNARDCNDNSMAIPLHNKMTLDDVKYVIDALCSLEQ